MDCGDTFLMPAPGGRAVPHLWIVVTTRDAATGECAIVSVTTLRNSKDQTIILRPGDHPFIRHDSTIFYGDGNDRGCTETGAGAEYRLDCLPRKVPSSKR